MTSNSVEFIDALSKDAHKIEVAMLLEFFQMIMQHWCYKHQNKTSIIKNNEQYMVNSSI